ncbi:MAG: nuclear transport factor 2 family protein [Flavobacterium sp.]|jgi:hypothetical protein|uniref:nuclear transport factor 2 family protein n=1 Tax=Flavobacterium sp. TaxID=239 RepID=UPI0035B46E35
MRSIVFLSSILLLFGCKSKSISYSFIGKDELHIFLNNWHQSAAEAHFDGYFNAIADDGIFIGTDAKENWSKEQFKVFAKPYFDRGKAWNFKVIQRNIYFSKDQKIVWFDELLTTQMKICRGSGVIQKTKDGWKIKHYVLSMTVPNENVDEVVKVKAKLEDILLEELVKN